MKQGAKFDLDDVKAALGRRYNGDVKVLTEAAAKPPPTREGK